MSKTLYLLRHCKSSWADAALADADRPLAKRGRKAGKRMGRELARRGWIPDLVLCSPTARTRETFARLAKGMEKAEPGSTPDVTFEKGLYLANADALLALARGLDNAHDSVLMIGHNSGLQDFAVSIPAGGKSQIKKVAAKFPTGALAVIVFEIEDWGALTLGAGRLTDAVYPRDLE